MDPIGEDEFVKCFRAIAGPLLAAAFLINAPVSAKPKDPAAVQRVKTALESLNLTEDQKAKIQPILVEQSDKVRAARADAKTDKKASARKVRELLVETETKIQPILTAEQWTKFRELEDKARAEQKAKRKNK